MNHQRIVYLGSENEHVVSTMKLAMADSGVPTLDCQWTTFANGNRRVYVKPDRVAELKKLSVIVMPASEFAHRAVMDLALFCDAVRSVTTSCEIDVHLPYLQYSRSNHDEGPGTAVGLASYVRLLETARPDMFYVYDLHDPASIIAFRGHARHVGTEKAVAQHLRNKIGNIDVVVAPDAGRYKYAKQVADKLHADVEVLAKTRTAHDDNASILNRPRPILEGKTVALVDDEVVSGSTLLAAVNEIVNNGATGIHICVTRSFASNETIERICGAPGVESFATTSLCAHDMVDNGTPEYIINVPMAGLSIDSGMAAYTRTL